MEIILKCYATLMEYQPKDETYEISEGETTGQVVDKLGIPREEINLVFVNGVRVGYDHVLEQDDRVGIFPVVGGG